MVHIINGHSNLRRNESKFIREQLKYIASFESLVLRTRGEAAQPQHVSFRCPAPDHYMWSYCAESSYEMSPAVSLD